MLRKSNVVPQSTAKFDYSKHLGRSNFAVGRGAILVKLKWSKTNQFGQRKLVLPPLCPVTHLKTMFERINCPKKVSAFSYKEGGRWKCWKHASWVNALRKLLDSLGFDGARWSGHSFRRGSASLHFIVLFH